ncbi:MAG: hypothetical protein LBH30_03450, partial [Prevotellaceae bacterium]|nr:hypothetical protein [Prevotellaceae bacterium]
KKRLNNNNTGLLRYARNDGLFRLLHRFAVRNDVLPLGCFGLCPRNDELPKCFATLAMTYKVWIC